ncbi:MAG TPA: flagellar biosynthesis regulator FlaF [Stellaceae bacterium]|nr:flagellar biosynthesis regulator FlaF [Stellaceae bacterium]
MSIAAYRRRKEAAETPRELERRAFLTVVGKLAEAQKTGGRAIIEACGLNYRLWTTLLLDLALPENGLPDDLKARLISIGLWVQRYTPQAMQGAALDPLISVNRSIAEGLSTTPPAGKSGTESPAPQLGPV